MSTCLGKIAHCATAGIRRGLTLALFMFKNFVKVVWDELSH
ncbi:unnamed protein product, partial [Didymodactylos carnosus]